MPEPFRVRFLGLSLTVAAVLALVPATAGAAKLRYHSCDGKKYWLVKDLEDPAVKLLRIKMRNSKADGYAPRCLVAEATAAEAQRGAADGKPPAELDVFGARWGVGKYTCTYEKRSGYLQAQCRHTGKDAYTVRFRLVS
jgi:hypothetical protein